MIDQHRLWPAIAAAAAALQDLADATGMPVCTFVVTSEGDCIDPCSLLEPPAGQIPLFTQPQA